MSQAEPNYTSLRCECGNVTEFIEYALRETSQPLTVKHHDPVEKEEWGIFQLTEGESTFPHEIQCRDCGEVVWGATITTKEMLRKEPKDA